ncbi:hypothetical protein DSC45_32795 [Streptomyces sp. YIM 130001]|uniref:DUF3093 domain-containing protein n=1 Tax=Streptomyces sp. YIM 130001 TaxID=2259644 RepID=UPI000E65BE69|nr:DUF3093 domain-containing protein [Streptomyces sp. YIM 130001]RII08625.1 hypothetical protein DSC45_32795 [Streptomyces sp. YIM 130001]
MQPSAQNYDERLTAPRSWWAIAVLIAIGCGVMLLPLGALPLLGGLIGGGALAAVAVSAYGSARVRVVAGLLVAGDAKIPVAALGEPEALDEAAALEWRMHRADPRAFMVLRSYVRTAVRIPVEDPEDPTPYVYLSTREPERLVTAVNEARAAHSGSESSR